MQAFRRIVDTLRQLRQLDKDTPARLKAYAESNLRQSAATTKKFEESRVAVGEKLSRIKHELDAKNQQMLDAEKARLLKLLDGIQIDEARVREEARRETAEQWAKILEASDVTGADVKAAREAASSTFTGGTPSGECSSGGGSDGERQGT